MVSVAPTGGAPATLKLGADFRVTRLAEPDSRMKSGRELRETKAFSPGCGCLDELSRLSDMFCAETRYG